MINKFNASSGEGARAHSCEGRQPHSPAPHPRPATLSFSDERLV